ncbi:MAG TPA: glutathione S-transferase family protein [Kofleriaceae bacterium]|jgi:glutathione S-transferase|nr:glutathione S-transferase family protein [Kofleriaceae bacterium]
MALKLHGTPLSHFTRKVRILLGELGVQYEMVWLSSVMERSPSAFADNPLMRVPTLVDGDRMLIESDHIARYLVGRYDASDWFGVKSDDPAAMNFLAVANGIMSNEVVIILAKRGGLAIEGVVYFDKLKTAIAEGLAWLDRTVKLDAPMTWGDITLVCMWQHLLHYKIVDGLDGFARIRERVGHFLARPAVAATTPEASFAEATAAGWKPPT